VAVGIWLIGVAELVETVVIPTPGDCVSGASRVVSWTVSIRARPSRVSRSPNRASDDAKMPGPWTRTRVRYDDVGSESVWLVMAASAGGPEATATVAVG
jgi:hypothetical protein